MAGPDALRAGAGRLTEALRPHPHRGDIVAAGAVVLAAGLLMVDVRMSFVWEPGALAVVLGAGAVLVYGMGLLAPLEGESPRPYHSILLLAGLVLATVALAQLALALGARAVFPPLDQFLPGGINGVVFFGDIESLNRGASPGALTWVALAVAALAVLGAIRANSAACTLFAAVAGGVAVLAFVQWVFDPRGVATARWILLALIIGFVAGLAYLRERHRRHAVMLVDAAGLGVIAIALTFQAVIEGAYFTRTVGAPTYAGVFSVSGGAGFGWDLALLLGSFGLIAYAAADREGGPGLLGALALLLSITVVGLRDITATLVGWPLFLVLVGTAGIVFGLRPRRPLPPPPDIADDAAETRPMPPPTGL
jgi:hypothetical protein